MAPVTRLQEALIDALSKRLTGSEWVAYAGMLARAGKRNQAWPNLTRLARLAGLSRTAVSEAVGSLCSKGLLEPLGRRPGCRTRMYRVLAMAGGADVRVSEHVTFGNPNTSRSGFRTRLEERYMNMVPSTREFVVVADASVVVSGELLGGEWEARAARMGVQGPSLAAFVQAYGAERVKEVLGYALEEMGAGRIHNAGGWVVSALRKGFDVAGARKAREESGAGAGPTASGYRPLPPEQKAAYDARVNAEIRRRREERREAERRWAEATEAIAGVYARVPAERVEAVRLEAIAAAPEVMRKGLGRVDLSRPVEGPAALYLVDAVLGLLAG
jgi:hypothetical protein